MRSPRIWRREPLRGVSLELRREICGSYPLYVHMVRRFGDPDCFAKYAVDCLKPDKSQTYRLTDTMTVTVAVWDEAGAV